MYSEQQSNVVCPGNQQQGCRVGALTLRYYANEPQIILGRKAAVGVAAVWQCTVETSEL